MIEPRLLLGSGPSPVPDRVLKALAQPTIGHLDPQFGELMVQTGRRLRECFVTTNLATLPISGTGSAGMDAMVANVVRPGDRIVCGVCGLFGERMADALGRGGAEVVRVEAQWGRAIEVERLIDAWTPESAAMFVVHGETSTGVAQPLDGLAEAVRADDGLLLVDCVTSLAGHPLRIDAQGVDAAFSGTQKCLNCPPGLAPFTLNDRAAQRVGGSRSWYFDLSLILDYWNDGETQRAYHHTAPINLVYALAEALEIVCAEGLEARWERHRRAHEALRSALSVLGLERLAPEGEELWPLLAVRVPDDVDDAAVRGALLQRHAIEISGGLGPFAGRLWRIGVMGEGARIDPQRQLVQALSAELGRDPAEAVAALEEGWR